MPVAYRDARRTRRAQGTPGRTRGATLVLRNKGLLAGLAAMLLGMSAGAPRIEAAFGSTRTISLYHIHTKESLTVTYKKDGKYVPEALKKLNWFLRDWRENEAIAMDPKTIDLLWEMHTELGSKVPIEIICGYRSDKTNKMLRRTVGGQARKSFHIRGKAIDATFPDIPLKQMRYSALIRERGGVGYYPTSGIPFVHVEFRARARLAASAALRARAAVPQRAYRAQTRQRRPPDAGRRAHRASPTQGAGGPGRRLLLNPQQAEGIGRGGAGRPAGFQGAGAAAGEPPAADARRLARRRRAAA